MKTVTILATGTHKEIMNTVFRLINNIPEWEADVALTIEEMELKLSARKYDLILLGAGTDEKKLRALLNTLQLNVPIVLHYGGGSGLLLSEIQQALKS